MADPLAVRPREHHLPIIGVGIVAAASTPEITRTPEETMQPATLVTMIVVLGIVWGGFAGLLITALRKESGKTPGE